MELHSHAVKPWKTWSVQPAGVVNGGWFDVTAIDKLLVYIYDDSVCGKGWQGSDIGKKRQHAGRCCSKGFVTRQTSIPGIGCGSRLCNCIGYYYYMHALARLVPFIPLVIRCGGYYYQSAMDYLSIHRFLLLHMLSISELYMRLYSEAYIVKRSLRSKKGKTKPCHT